MENYLNKYTKIFEKKIQLHKDISVENIRLVYGVDYGKHKLFIIDSSEINEEYHNTYLCNGNVGISKTIHDDISFNFYYFNRDIIIYPYIEYQTIENMRQENIRFIKEHNHFLKIFYSEATLIVKLEKEFDNYFIVYYIKTKVLDNIKANKKESKKNLTRQILANGKMNSVYTNCNIQMQKIMNNVPYKITGKTDKSYKNDKIVSVNSTEYNERN